MVKYVSYRFTQMEDELRKALKSSKLPYGMRAGRRRRGARKKFSEEVLQDKLKSYKDGTLTGKLTYDQLAWLECISRTNELVIGGRYWISQHWELTGAFVKILEKNTDINSSGLPSSVTVEVVEPVGVYKVGDTKTLNATQIHDERDHSSKDNFIKSLHSRPFSLVGTVSR